MNCELFQKSLRGTALPARRLSWLFCTVLVAFLALALFWPVTGFARVTTETIELKTHKYEIVRDDDGNIVRITTSFKSEWTETEYIDRFDKQGRLTSVKTTKKEYTKTKPKKLSRHEISTVTYNYNLEVSGTLVARDELTGKEKTEGPWKMDKFPMTANQFYKSILERKRADERQKFLAPGATTPGEQKEPTKGAMLPGTAVPGAPATPVEYAAVTPKWLKGAYVSLNFGASFTASSALTPSYRDSASFGGNTISLTGRKSFPGNVNAAPRAAVAVGQYGCPFSDRKFFDYIGWKIETSFQGLNYPKQSGAYQQTLRVNGDPVAHDFGTADFSGNGGLFNMAFLFTARYGFLPTPEQPFGRLQPMVGVGPVLMVNWFNPKIRLTSRNGVPVDDTIDFEGKTSVNVGLAAEAVLRYYPLKNVFVDLGYRFTYGQPSFTFEKRNFRMTFDNSLYTHRLALGVGLSF